MSPELEKIRTEILDINERARSLCDGLGEDALACRPAPGRWSIAENLIHLRITTETFLRVVDPVIEAARRDRRFSSGPFHMGLGGRLWVWYAEPPSRIGVPAPKSLRPLITGPAADALPSFLASQHSLLQSVAAADGLDLNKVRFRSPIGRITKLDLLEFFSIATAHSRRHLWQAANVRRDLP